MVIQELQMREGEAQLNGGIGFIWTRVELGSACPWVDVMIPCSTGV
jgi:hypothetical protein